MCLLYLELCLGHDLDWDDEAGILLQILGEARQLDARYSSCSVRDELHKVLKAKIK